LPPGSRAELTVLERDHHIAEWIRLTEEREKSLAQVEPMKSGIRAQMGPKIFD
jgi:hypothetical protein